MAQKVVVDGELSLLSKDIEFLNSKKIALLESIEKCGSLSKAAKDVGISYKNAWDMLSLINNTSPEPIVLAKNGGKGGGGTKLTEYGKNLIQNYKFYRSELENLYKQIETKIDNFGESIDIFRRWNMRTSARNVLSGKIDSIKDGAVNSEVALKTAGGELLFATLTKESVKELDLQKGGSAYAIIKASSIILSIDEPRISARNIIKGEIEKIHTGEINSEISVAIKGENSIVAIITNESAKNLKLHIGCVVYAIFKSNSVIIGI